MPRLGRWVLVVLTALPLLVGLTAAAGWVASYGRFATVEAQDRGWKPRPPRAWFCHVWLASDRGR